jgi:methionine synthase II (cobalamin-independent)
MEAKVTLEMQVEELVEAFPEAVRFLTRRGLRCIRCGEPVWGTLKEFLLSESVEDPQRLVEELNAYIQERRREAG